MLTIKKKLLIAKIFTLILLFIIVTISVYSIQNLSKTAHKMEVEYNEVNVAHELQISFQQLNLTVKEFLIHRDTQQINNFDYYLVQTNIKLEECKKIFNHNQNQEHLANFEKDFIRVTSLSKKLFKLNVVLDAAASEFIMEELSSISSSAVEEINKISKETEREMNIYIADNRKTNINGKWSVIFTGIFTVFCSFIFSHFFLKGIIKPLDNMMQTTQKIASGNLSAKTEILAHDEIGNLMTSFNNMIGILNRTTVSRDYFNHILNKMNDSLIITDINHNIMVVNQATLNILGYTEKEIIGLSFHIILGKKFDDEVFTKNTIINDLTEQKQLHNIYNTYFSKNGEKIPVLFSGSLMLNEQGAVKGMICITNHHTTENSASSLNQENNFQSTLIKTVDEIPLTPREREIMKLIAEERSNQEIAELLFISVRTVETHRKNIMQKLHTKSVIALVKYAALNGII
ncbi:MAG: hypothetical protein CO118_05175 [Flavobacteriales bacterium CG_4_9_14_3_um_filter_32_8]|nr:MAG: hypothetical protein CO118_05175 [Flavobacteriales bacterium CG_4_9_14_3_um_filter_32_8]